MDLYVRIVHVYFVRNRIRYIINNFIRVDLNFPNFKIFLTKDYSYQLSYFNSQLLS